MKTPIKRPDQIRVAHEHYKELADNCLQFLRRACILDEGTHAREEISNLCTRFRNKQYALEFVMPELSKKDEKLLQQTVLLKKVYDFLDTYGTANPEGQEGILQKEIFEEIKKIGINQTF